MPDKAPRPRTRRGRCCPLRRRPALQLYIAFPSTPLHPIVMAANCLLAPLAGKTAGSPHRLAAKSQFGYNVAGGRRPAEAGACNNKRQESQKGRIGGRRPCMAQRRHDKRTSVSISPGGIPLTQEGRHDEKEGMFTFTDICSASVGLPDGPNHGRSGRPQLRMGLYQQYVPAA